MSISGELSNELFYLHPEKVIGVGYVKGEDVKISFRAKAKIRDKVVSLASELGGRGGGHEQAFAITISLSKFEDFREKLEKSL